MASNVAVLGMVGEALPTNLELANTENEVINLTALLQGAEALVVLFHPYTYAEVKKNSMENLILDVNDRLEFFEQEDVRVIVITREPPSTTRHWKSDMNINMDVYSDCSLDVSAALVGTFDLSLYFIAKQGVTLGTWFVSMPAIMIVGGDGRVISKYVAQSPETVQVSAEDIFRMCGINK
mmetsp:Transcript_16698/g.37058  ORF Transcript_16698/g.37058 Transcript_16698/m.37058 type:complete len:180 (-) Transcript_16698:338-877(-)|eukprot:CAMPEP_0173190410 /NCGR_PEP_ID=MMETSP1141-20130122/12330_1 /TAXON_ID=483371 /ORGANISM="non described non described, Strain CCMP2298" /LENGTH=179 /DNA_ID=CAMNT_0014114517 /DNA_START=63 /DNA_END=602 /DNA_ORIENTATION=-